jgi:hypothetical protein
MKECKTQRNVNRNPRQEYVTEKYKLLVEEDSRKASRECNEGNQLQMNSEGISSRNTGKWEWNRRGLP